MSEIDCPVGTYVRCRGFSRTTKGTVCDVNLATDQRRVDLGNNRKVWLGTGTLVKL